MIRCRAALVRAALGRAWFVLLAGLLAGCAAAGAPSGPATAMTSGSAPASADRSGSASTQLDLAASPACPRVAPAPPVVPATDGLPDLILPCLGAGPAVRLADLRGTPMVLNVWAAWCVNCPREMPLFAALERKAGDRLRFFGVHYRASRGYGLAAARDFGVTFPSVQDGDGTRTTVALRVTGPPTTLFVAADGRVAGRKVGEITSARELAALVHRYLGVSA